MSRTLRHVSALVLLAFLGASWNPPEARALNQPGDYEAVPPFLTSSVPPLVMLVMGRNHKLFYEAYNDASDLDEDGDLDIRYEPGIDYYGYFDPYKCYTYSTTSNRFQPVRVTPDKTCNDSGGTLDHTDGEWSGNFLNYLTMSRMDAVRKVLYGGMRSTDTAASGTASVVLERAFIPQDAHSWGKEYDPAASGVSIADVAPLAEPTPGKRHLFACTTLDADGDDQGHDDDPLLRVATNSDQRIWEWVSKERPVADDSVVGGTGSGSYNDHPDNHAEFDDLVYGYAYEANQYTQNVASGETYYATSNGTVTWEIHGQGNPWGDDYVYSGGYDDGAHDQQNYLTIFEGAIQPPQSGTYWFAADGDDALELIITGVTNLVSGNPIATGQAVVTAWYGGHGADSGTTDPPSDACTEDLDEFSSNSTRFKGAVYLSADASYDIEFRHQENTGQDSYYLYWKKPGTATWEVVPADAFNVSGVTDVSGVTLTQKTYDCVQAGSSLDNYVVRTVVCDPGTDSNGESLLESNCWAYPDGTYKPTGLLHRYGETERMYFGLVTGSYRQNTAGGVLRKNMSSFTDEMDPDTGQFTTTRGIVHTLDEMRITGYDYGSYSYQSNCGWIASRPINEGECRMWGNPLAEMMYETLRYFAGEESPTPEFVDAISDGDDDGLDLPMVSWNDPYDSAVSGYPYCARPFMLVVSDVFPTFDSDHLPGAYFDGFTGTLTSHSDPAQSMDVEALADAIAVMEGETGTTPHFIGQVGDEYDGSCAPKTMTGWGNVRGLCPEEPTKRGSFYTPSVAYFGRKEDMSGVTDEQHVYSYMVGLSSPLPRIEIDVGGKTVSLVPFAKSVGGYGISAAQGDFQPTNSIVDFYVEDISDTSGTFRINYEDVSQGADHDMDAICRYEYTVETDPTSGVSRVKIELDSQYAAGSIIQHMGYTISGTTNDGTYLEVRDADTGAGSDPDYFLDTPGDCDPHTDGDTCYQDGNALPLTKTRYFWPGDTTAATILENPLWYGAKYGGFEETSGTTVTAPTEVSEWDEDGDGTPDTYFYVVNPLKLEEQLNRSFAEILARVSSGTAASVISNSRSGEGAIYQSIFYAEYEGKASWVGKVHALMVDAYGNMRVDTNQNQRLDLADDYIVQFNENEKIDLYRDVDGNGRLELIEGDTLVASNLTVDDDQVRYLWDSNDWLNELTDAGAGVQRSYSTNLDQRYIFTFADADGDMICDLGEQKDFVLTTPTTLPTADQLVDPGTIFPYLQPYPSFNPPDDVLALSGTTPVFQAYLQQQTARIVNYVRGIDQAGYESSGTSPAFTIPAFRNRRVDYDGDGTEEIWRLGDVIHSTPTVVGRPAESYDLLYRDGSYSAFYNKFKNRRSMVYVGANDGMFHAFNGGFYDNGDKAFLTQPLDGNRDPITTYTDFDLGAEIWAYVPYNLLPHLHWLTQEQGYGHVYYCDLKPKVFDAKVFPDDTHYMDTDTDPNWGTLLVGGMRLGGGRIQADMDKMDGNSFFSGTDRTMSSAYFILDVTDPESPPEVIAELAFPKQGFTTCFPAVIVMRNQTITGGNVTFDEPGDWYLVLGSGPRTADGADTTALRNTASTEPAVLYLVDLVRLVRDGELWMLDSNGLLQQADPSGTTPYPVYAELEDNAFVSDPITVDTDLDFNSDVAYFGTVEGAAGTWGGRMRRIVMESNTDETTWTSDSTLIDLSYGTLSGSVGNGQPVVAPASVGLDREENLWVFFGTGRFFNRADALNSDAQSYYGIKDPMWTSVSRSFDLLDVSNAKVYQGGQVVQGVSGVTDYAGVEDAIALTQGWYLDFPASKERNLGQAVLLGDIVTFTSYIPSLDPCEFEGTSNLWALSFNTGTAYSDSVIGLDASDTVTLDGVDHSRVLRSISLGKGFSLTPNVHVGRQEGSKAYIQTSTGAIEAIDQANPGLVKSGKLSWEDESVLD